MDDYYEMLGVERGADKETIRAAYRERRAAADAAGEGGRAEAARLNRAWNVLSDDLQRGRYDERLTAGADDDGGSEAESAMSDALPPPPPPGRAARGQRVLGPPTIATPAGTTFPEPKRRMKAMGTDLLVLFLVFVGSQFAAQAYVNSARSATVDAIEAKRDTLDEAKTDRDVAKKALKKAEDADPPDADTVASAKTEYDAAKKEYSAAEKALETESRKLQPVYNLISTLFFLFGFAYLVVPSALSGQTLGKRLQRLRVLREDGSRIRPTDALKRYGLIVVVTYALSFVLGPLAAVIVLVGVTTWTRNPNMQALQDRIAHTIVVAEVNE